MIVHRIGTEDTRSESGYFAAVTRTAMKIKKVIVMDIQRATLAVDDAALSR